MRKALTLTELMVTVALMALVGAMFWMTTRSLTRTVEFIETRSEENIRVAKVVSLYSLAHLDGKTDQFIVGEKYLTQRSGNIYHGEKEVMKDTRVKLRSSNNHFDIYEIDIEKYNIKIDILKRRDPWE